MNTPGQDVASKSAWRRRLLRARQQVPADVRAAEAEALAAAVRAAADDLGETVCGYVPFGTEPGSLALLDALRAAGRRVLVPVVVDGQPLDWARYEGADTLVDGAHGTRQPIGPRLGGTAIGTAATVLVPALAVDRRGIRLGRGGGFYDRSLPLAAPGTRLVAVLRDEELVDRLPAERHDVPMTDALTPGRGLLALG